MIDIRPFYCAIYHVIFVINIIPFYESCQIISVLEIAKPFSKIDAIISV